MGEVPLVNSQVSEHRCNQGALIKLREFNPALQEYLSNAEEQHPSVDMNQNIGQPVHLSSPFDLRAARRGRLDPAAWPHQPAPLSSRR